MSASLTQQCAHCQLRGQCLPPGLSPDEWGELRAGVPGHRRIRRSQTLFRRGQTFRAIYAIRLGFFKSYVVAQDGANQITGFQMAGDILGLDGIGTGVHTQSVVALEDSDVCVFPYAQLEMAARQLEALQRHIHRVMSREIVREQAMVRLLGAVHAEERVAAFLLDLAERYEALGYSGSEFYLRMTREEMGAYLGLKLETVSRMLAHLQECGLIAAHNRYVRIMDKPGLAERAGRSASLRAHSHSNEEAVRASAHRVNGVAW
jgi:CRP/FNR family transcriptional regulator